MPTYYRQTHGTVTKRQIMITATWHPEDNKSKQPAISLPQLYYQWVMQNLHAAANTR